MIERHLTGEEKDRIWEAIRRERSEDDRYPVEVIQDQFGGDEEAYLKTMAGWHDVPLQE